MDISPGSTPTEESMMERITFSALSPSSTTNTAGATTATSASTANAIASLPLLIQQLSEKNAQKVDSQHITQQGMNTDIYWLIVAVIMPSLKEGRVHWIT